MTLKEVLQILPFDSNVEVRIISRNDSNVSREDIMREAIEFNTASYNFLKNNLHQAPHIIDNYIDNTVDSHGVESYNKVVGDKVTQIYIVWVLKSAPVTKDIPLDLKILVKYKGSSALIRQKDKIFIARRKYKEEFNTLDRICITDNVREKFFADSDRANGYAIYATDNNYEKWSKYISDVYMKEATKYINDGMQA